MKRLLIVGSTSIVGKALARRLAQSYSITLAGRREADVPLDLANRNVTLDASLRFDAVVHTAADFARSSASNLVDTEIINGVGTANVCRVAAAAGATHVIYLSTHSATYHYGDAYYGIYGVSKRHGEELARLACDTAGIVLSTIRPTQLYDAQSACRKHQPLFYTLIDKAERGENITLNGRHDARRNYLFLDDLCEIIERVIACRPDGTFTCAAPETLTLSQIATLAYRSFGRGGRVVFDEAKPDIPDIPDAIEDDLYDRIKYAPRTLLADGIAQIKAARSAG